MFEFLCLSEKKMMLWLDDSDMCCFMSFSFKCVSPPLLSLMLDDFAPHVSIDLTFTWGLRWDMID